MPGSGDRHGCERSLPVSNVGGIVIEEKRSLWWLLLGAMACTGVPVFESSGQNFPTRPLCMMIGFAPGGATDILGRLVVHPSVPARNARELIALARANPGKLNFASSGIGSVTQLRGELMKSM